MNQKNIEELIMLLQSVKLKITDDSDMAYTSKNTAGEVRNEIDDYIRKIKASNKDSIEEINILFAPTGSFHEHAITNNWNHEYLRIAAEFDRL